MLAVDTAMEEVEELLADVAAYKWLNIRVPHGFELVELETKQLPVVFPEGVRHFRVLATLDLPVVFQAKNGRAHKADRGNLEELRLLIEEACASNSASRIELCHWSVQPKKDPQPRRDLSQPDQHWRVTAEFKAA